MTTRRKTTEPVEFKIGDTIELQAYEPTQRLHGEVIDTPTKTASKIRFETGRVMLISNQLLRKKASS